MGSRMSGWNRRTSPVLCALALCSGVGCQTSGFRGNGLESSARSDLQGQLDRAEQGIADARRQAADAGQQLAQVQQRLDGQGEIQALLQERIDALLKENHDLHEELTAVVMNAAGAPVTSPASAIQQVGSTSPAAGRLPATLERALAGLADNNAAVQFVSAEAAIRTPSEEVFERGDILRPAAKKMLQDFARVANEPEAKKFNFLIVAHAAPNAAIPKEWIVDHPTKWHLTAHQAIAVQQFLEESGLAANRVGIVSYGGQQPLVDGKDEAANRANARVEIFVTPPDPPR